MGDWQNRYKHYVETKKQKNLLTFTFNLSTQQSQLFFSFLSLKKPDNRRWSMPWDIVFFHQTPKSGIGKATLAWPFFCFTLFSLSNLWPRKRIQIAWSSIWWTNRQKKQTVNHTRIISSSISINIHENIITLSLT